MSLDPFADSVARCERNNTLKGTNVSSRDFHSMGFFFLALQLHERRGREKKTKRKNSQDEIAIFVEIIV